MAKVDWITWKTDKNEIINPDNIEKNVAEFFSEFDHYINSIAYNELHDEIVTGGLNESAFNVMGVSPANEEAERIIDSIERMNEIVNKIKSDIYKSTIDQKNIEKQQLIDSLQNKILEEENKMNNALKLKDKLQTNSDIISFTDIDDVIQISAERIKVLKERLDVAQTL